MLRLRRRIPGLLSLAALLLAGCDNGFRAQREFALNAVWAGYRQLVVDNANGPLELTVHDANTLNASGTIHAHGSTPEEARLNAERVSVVALPDPTDAAVLLVRLDCPDEIRRKGAGASIRLAIPNSCRATLRTSNGSVTASGLSHDVTAATSNARIALRDITGNASARTSNGSVELIRVTGSVHAESSNGRIDLASIVGDCDVQTSNGSVRGDAIRGSLAAVSSNGSIDVDVLPPAGGRVALRTSNASIRAALPADLRAEVRLTTSNGNVRHTFGGDAMRVIEATRSRFAGVLNGGDRAGQVELRTSNGSITLDRRPG